MVKELQDLGIDVKETMRGNVKVKCPKCSEGRKNKNEPCLSVDVDNGRFTCWNCGWIGGVRKIQPKKEYYVPPMGELKTLSESVIKWFKDIRHISNQTLLRYKISEGVDYMPQVQAERKTIRYNYFSPSGDLVNIKSRDAEKNFKLVSGAMLVPFGMDVAFDNSYTEILWVEGENDTLACFEDGVRFSISVPNGASKGNQKLEWLDECYGLFEGKKHYIGVDMDEAGRSLAAELSRRLGKENCLIVNWPEKDANDTLIKYGKGSIANAVANARPYPIEGIEDADSVDVRLNNLYHSGPPKTFDLGYEMDNDFKIHSNQVTLITGVPGHGKSTMLKNVMLRLAKAHEWKFLVYSAEETSVEDALSDMCSIAYRKPFFEHPIRPRITVEEKDAVRGFMSEHFKYYSLQDNEQSVSSILAKCQELVRRSGVNALVIDNMATVERGMKSTDRHNEVRDMLNDMGKFAKKNDVHIFLVAHPKKMTKMPNGMYAKPDGYDVGDSSHYYNLVDNGWTLYRDYERDHTELYRWKARSRHSGKVGSSFFKFDLPSGSYASLEGTNDGIDTTKFQGQPLSNEKTQRFKSLF